MLLPTLLLAVLTCNPCHDDHSATGNHPVGVTYDSSRADLKRPAPRELLIDGRVECASCHVPHEEESAAAHRLRAESTTALCMSCHVVR
jgi:predicted CXXCH cytochrome family protein